MKIYFSNAHNEHSFGHPSFSPDVDNVYFEIPQRVHSILVSLKTVDWAEINSPVDFGEETILEIHPSHYLDYLKHAYDEWNFLSTKAGMAFIPYTPGFDPQTVGSVEIPDQDGFFMTDMNVPINAYTFSAALTSAHSALSAAQTVSLNAGSSFAISRPPGHHAGPEMCGGFCYLNNAAISAQWLSKRGKVAILDIDYHAGNGTQAIFYNRADVLTISLHADPSWEYPLYCGFAHEIGAGAGEGFHRNFPLPHQTGDDRYRQVLGQALELVSNFSPDFLVVSAGFDTCAGDPLGDFTITRDGYSIFGKMIAELSLPTTIILEGGYKIDELGDNVVAFLKPFVN